MAKNEEKKEKKEKEAKGANEAKEKPSTGVSTQAPAKPAEGRDFVMKHGQILVGADDLRRTGDIVKRSELTPEEAEKFLARGTIAEQE